MRQFTKQEATVIRKAFDEITYQVDATDMTLPREWALAFKSEKRQCTNADWARANMAHQFGLGAFNETNVADLIRIREGCRIARMIGAAFMAEKAPVALALRELWADVCAARTACFTRRLDQ